MGLRGKGSQTGGEVSPNQKDFIRKLDFWHILPRKGVGFQSIWKILGQESLSDSFFKVSRRPGLAVPRTTTQSLSSEQILPQSLSYFLKAKRFQRMPRHHILGLGWAWHGYQVWNLMYTIQTLWQIQKEAIFKVGSSTAIVGERGKVQKKYWKS